MAAASITGSGRSSATLKWTAATPTASRLAEHDYRGVSLEQALERLFSEHQEYVVLEAAGDLRKASEGDQHT